MTEVWLRAEGLTCREPVAKPITMPRGFRRRERRRRRWREPPAIFRDVTVRSTGGLSVVTGASGATATLAAALAGVLRPHAGRVETSHLPVAVLRARARLVVDLKVRTAVLRELRLRGIPTSVGWDLVDDVCHMAGVDPDGWSSDLEKQEYARLAPAAVVCSDAPIVILDSLFNGQSPEFDEALLARLAARSRRLDLVTILCAPERRGMEELVEALDVQNIQSLPRGSGGDATVGWSSGADLDDDDDEDDAEDDDEEIDGAMALDETEVAPRIKNLVTFDNIRFSQFGDEVDTIDGRAPFTIRMAVTSGFEGPAEWSVRLVHRSANVVLAAADATCDSGAEVREAVVEVPAGINSGKLALHAKVDGTVGGHRHVVMQPTVTFVPIAIADDDAHDAVTTGQLSFTP